ncbi:hypothetical protein [Streptomyces sp. NPDC088915]|uniref:hypothetical protein n=1 Tax=Streptomyces sp. NPDC088915 TaxID=3365912 RepID=UPI0037FB7631
MQQNQNARRFRAAALVALLCGVAAAVVSVVGDDATLRAVCVGITVVLIAGAGAAWKAAAR